MTVHSNWRRVLSLSRLALAPTEPQNAESILIGWSVRRIRREGKWVALVTFADESQGHTGTIYRATNWTYVGRTKPEARMGGPVGSSGFAARDEEQDEGADGIARIPNGREVLETQVRDGALVKRDLLTLVVLLSVGTLAVFYAGVVVGRRDGVTLVRTRCAP
jgi:hypothetical protein